MQEYYMNSNRQALSGEHEVHETGCKWDADPENRLILGYFGDGIDAVEAAKELYPWLEDYINGCIHCNPEANTD
jgi:hypothetical protein